MLYFCTEIFIRNKRNRFWETVRLKLKLKIMEKKNELRVERYDASELATKKKKILKKVATGVGAAALTTMLGCFELHAGTSAPANEYLDTIPMTVKQDSDTIVQQTITGVVQDELGEPVIGATVMIQGTGQGTVTDIDGRFSISAPANAVLIFSFVGMETVKRRVAASQTEMNVTINIGTIEMPMMLFMLGGNGAWFNSVIEFSRT